MEKIRCCRTNGVSHMGEKEDDVGGDGKKRADNVGKQKEHTEKKKSRQL